MRSQSTRLHIKILITAVGAGALLAACSSGGSASPAASGGGAAAGASGAGAGASCKQVTAAQVQPLLTATITKSSVASVPDQVTVNGTAQQCTFATRESAQAITLTVVGGADADNFYIGQVQGITPVTVPGVGDKSARDGGHGSDAVVAEQGGVTCLVDTSGADQIPGVGALEEAAGDTSDIGDANDAAIAAALGTLCNRVFGSGNTTPDLSTLLAAAAAASASSSPSDDALPTGFALPTDSAS